MNAISLVIADGSELSCQMLTSGLNRCRGKFKVRGFAVDAAGALQQITAHSPDIALISSALRDGPEGGFKVLRELQNRRCSTLVVVLLDRPDQENVLRAFSSGAKGVLVRTDTFNTVCKCIRCVHAGQVWANREQMQIILEALAERGPLAVLDAKGTPLLTKREEEVVHMVAEGLSNHQISSELGLSPHTVKNHLFRIYDKIGVSNRVELILYALGNNRAPVEPPPVAA